MFLRRRRFLMVDCYWKHLAFATCTAGNKNLQHTAGLAEVRFEELPITRQFLLSTADNIDIVTESILGHNNCSS